RRWFAELAALAAAARRDHPGLDTLSMGMSGDLEAAVTEGATMVRIGTALFGERLQSTA
ncbi:MAG: YggS family pyridoxal phosphate enzyme, partial [Gammaproteobacteria bacterium]